MGWESRFGVKPMVSKGWGLKNVHFESGMTYLPEGSKICWTVVLLLFGCFSLSLPLALL